MISVSVAQFSHPGLAFTDLMALLLSWFKGDTLIDERDNPAEQVCTAAVPGAWEEQMGRNLEELRGDLGMEPVREGPWSWQANPQLQAALAA